ncbi:MAG: hypothetical protein JSU63_18215, partial [Phycisphaerales bacterium]
EGTKVTIWRGQPAGESDLESSLFDCAPGLILRADDVRGTLVRTGDGAMWLTETLYSQELAGADESVLAKGRRFAAAPDS